MVVAKHNSRAELALCKWIIAQSFVVKKKVYVRFQREPQNMYM